MPIRTLAEARRALEEFYSLTNRPKGQAYTLDHMRSLLAAVGNPQDSLHAIHVAGTSGKTSTAYYAASLLRAAGHTVGLTVSPHVVDINDRVQINGQPLDEATFCADIDQFLLLVHKSGIQPNYFEFMMAFAFWEFASKRLEYAVIEVGVGGLLDMSNTLERSDKVSIITDIGFDHMHVLGRTLPEIAAQKAGIIQYRNATYMFRQGSEIMSAVQERARQKQADLHLLDDQEIAEGSAELPLFQRRNFTLADAAVSHVLARDGHIPLGLHERQRASEVQIPGRMETFNIGGKTVILDGAHNEQKLTALLGSVAERYPGQQIAALTAFIEKPEALDRTQRCLKIIEPVVSELTVTEFGGPQDAPFISVAADIVGALAKTAGFSHVIAEQDPHDAFHKLLSSHHDVVIVVGSFFLLNHIRPLALEMRT